jgi:hypothetical protein
MLDVVNVSENPIIPDQKPVDISSGSYANLRYNGKIIFQFASIMDFVHFWTIFSGYNSEMLSRYLGLWN